MPNRIAAKGMTRVILVLNMKRFIRDEVGRKIFETVRGSDEFAKLLQTSWVTSLQNQSHFSPVAEDGMSDEDVGFATGVFRSLMLRRLSAPMYKLDKSKVSFPADLESNFQFKTLFKKAWDRWTICIRPTMTGFFVIRLTYNYQQTPRPLIDLAKDAIKLQEPLDVPSAFNWLQKNRKRYENEPETLSVKEHSVKVLLKWLGADIDKPLANETHYYPVQWKLAVEAINLFVENGRFTIPHPDGTIQLRPSPPTLSLPMHDSYIVYHFDELLAEPGLISKAKRGKMPTGSKAKASLNDIRNSKPLRNAIVNLLEGTVLRDSKKSTDQFKNNDYFPSPRWSRADALFDDPEENLGSWNDELCLFTGRAALIMPSSKWKAYEMAVSTVPSATLKVQYTQYWAAIARMIEFVLEVRVLAQLIESDSYRLLGQIANTIERIRAKMFKGDIVIEGSLKAQLTSAAHLQRIAALAQSIGHAPYWGRAEYAIQKAERLFELLDLPRIFTHIDRNIDSINSVADHVDELYLADLAEKGNDKATVISMGLTAVSFILVLLILPSFWADWMDVHDEWKNPILYNVIFYSGSILGIGLAVGSIVLLWAAIRREGLKKLWGYLFSSRS